MDSSNPKDALVWLVLRDLEHFSRAGLGQPLYGYQLAPAQAIVDSVVHGRGREFAVLFPRQSGKNETQAQVEAYLLNLLQRVPGAAIIKAQPTFRPQALNALDRLERRLRTWLSAGRWEKRHGYQIRLGEASLSCLSAGPRANVAGATARVLLQVDEAQDVLEDEWDKKFIPMAASANATIVYWGTAWNSRTLLARTIRRLRAQEQADGQQRVFEVGPEVVRQANPAYGAAVDREVAKQGRQHPMVRTQFFNEELDAETGMFPPARRMRMRGRHRRQTQPTPGTHYALLLDVGGEAPATRTGPLELRQADLRRDATALTLVEVDLETLADPVLRAPTYRAVYRQLWRGAGQPQLYAEVRALALQWEVRCLVVDATGLGAGLAAFLAKALPRCSVIEFKFSTATKSALGWQFMALCDAGRWQDYEVGAGDPDGLTFWKELEHCQHEVAPGPSQALRWGVPDGTRDEHGEPVHDDTVISAALAAVLDEHPWHVDTGPAHVIRGKDPLEEMSRGF